MNNNFTPTVSVIMGIYNCEDTLSYAINSILTQTYQDFELILCNDGSNDRTYEIAKLYQQQYSEKIVLLNNEINKGLNYTLNKCLEYARGKYIARMDGDDCSLPKRLQEEVEFLDNHPEYAFVSANLEVFDDEGIWGYTDFKSEPLPCDLVRGSAFSHSACMVRKSVFIEVGGYSEGKILIRVEDKHLWHKIYVAGYKGKNLESILYSYRDDKDSYKKRKFKYRFNEVYVNLLTVQFFSLSPLYYLIAMKPIVIGILPYPVYNWFHQKKLSRK